jgi:hypothetical protein
MIDARVVTEIKEVRDGVRASSRVEGVDDAFSVADYGRWD